MQTLVVDHKVEMVVSKNKSVSELVLAAAKKGDIDFPEFYSKALEKVAVPKLLKPKIVQSISPKGFYKMYMDEAELRVVFDMRISLHVGWVNILPMIFWIPVIRLTKRSLKKQLFVPMERYLSQEIEKASLLLWRDENI